MVAISVYSHVRQHRSSLSRFMSGTVFVKSHNFATMSRPTLKLPRPDVPCELRNKDRSYKHALKLLNEIASNRTVTSAVSQSAKDMNAQAIPEMLEWLEAADISMDELKQLRVIHVAGTKGKGSVSAMVSSILREWEDDPSQRELRSIGLYTSPHLITPRERIQINSAPVSQADFAESFHNLWDQFSFFAHNQNHNSPTSAGTKPGYFRYLTLMALDIFLTKGVTTAVIECGIGGEYDSTNILPPEAVTVAAITKLGIDHTPMLGNTLEDIAWHKAGIMKKGTMTYSSLQSKAAMEVLQARAAETGAKIAFVDVGRGLKELRTNLQGNFQLENARLAVLVAGHYLAEQGSKTIAQDFYNAQQYKTPIENLDNEAFALSLRDWPKSFDTALQNVSWPGRCQIVKDKRQNIEWWIDGAHNEDSIKVVAEWFRGDAANEGTKHSIDYLVFNQQIRDGVPLLKLLHQELSNFSQVNIPVAVFCQNNVYASSITASEDCESQTSMRDAWLQLQEKHDCTLSTDVTASIEEAVESVRQKYSRLHADSNFRARVLVTGSLHLVGGLLQVLSGKDKDDESWM